ncbi:lipoprotein signal peptidase [Pseudofulvibacter geojedonensis]|uniref:Lipoprotein signal peptidase n=1 Tax=Pseudofulvibacter geojedonensis TaxID=1123758 RepID=A0ABW3I2C8_9FLAO
MSLKKAFGIITLILIVDQVVKLYIKTNFNLGEYINVFGLSWFEIRFVENPGMAWGSKLSDFLPISEPSAKIFLTSFRLVAIGFIAYWLVKSVRKNAPKLLIIAISLIFAGAFGNNLDSLFYGLIFDSGTTFNEQYNDWIGYTGVSQMNGAGYSNMMQGCVVDMLRFPFASWTWPEWMPGIGGKYFTFFDPVFNIADMAISTGVGILLVFNKKVFPQEEKVVLVDDNISEEE